MIYLIYTDVDFGLMEISVNDIIHNHLSEINEFNLIKFDAKENSLDEIYDECVNSSFLDSKKVIIVYDSYFLSTQRIVGIDVDYKPEKIISYLKKPIEDVELIFLLNNSKINKTNEIYKLISESGKIIYLPPLKEREWFKVTKDLINKNELSIDYDAYEELAKRTLNDRLRLINEISKLKLYGNNITIKEIKELVNEPLEDKIYILTNLLLEGNINEVLLTYKDLLINNNDPNILLSMLANQFRYYYSINYLKDNGETIVDIAKITKSKDIRVKICLNASKCIKNKISSILEEIYNLDLSIKTSQVNPIKGLELFLINFRNKYLD